MWTLTDSFWTGWQSAAFRLAMPLCGVSSHCWCKEKNNFYFMWRWTPNLPHHPPASVRGHLYVTVGCTVALDLHWLVRMSKQLKFAGRICVWSQVFVSRCIFIVFLCSLSRQERLQVQGNEAAAHVEVTWKLEDGDAVADVPQVFGTSSAGFKIG